MDPMASTGMAMLVSFSASCSMCLIMFYALFMPPKININDFDGGDCAYLFML